MTRARSRLAIAAAVLAVAAAAAPQAAVGDDLPSCESAPCASDAGRPIVLLSYFRDRHLTRLTVATLRANLPTGTPVYYGGYWGSDLHPRRPPPPPGPPPPPETRPRPPMPNPRYAPIFTLVPTEFWKKRGDITTDQAAILRRSSQRTRSGRIPSPAKLMRMDGRSRYLWAVELGRRWRDRIRARRARGQRVVTWQLDELSSAVPHDYKLRQLIMGVMRGVTYGRSPLDDAKVPGIVFATGDALALARRSGGDLESFWRALDDCTLYLVGEEYPPFVGSPTRTARHYGGWRSALWHAGGARRSLANKYVVGLTPGYRPDSGLGGNVSHRSRGAVVRWRAAYVRARAKTGVMGFGEYNFVDKNASFAVMQDVMRALSLGVRVVLSRS